jgi:hypothetical protein
MAAANKAATSTHRIVLVAPRPRRPVTGNRLNFELIEQADDVVRQFGFARPILSEGGDEPL